MKSSGMPLVILLTIGLFFLYNLIDPKVETPMTYETLAAPIPKIKPTKTKAVVSNFLDIYDRYDKKPEKKSIEIAFIGDMMFDRNIRKRAEQKSYNYILEDVRDELKTYDLVIGNLEGPVTDYDSKTKQDSFTFTFDEKIIDVLKDEAFLKEFEEKTLHADTENFFSEFKIDKITAAQLILAINVMIHSPTDEGRHKATQIVKSVFKEKKLSEEQQHKILDFVSDKFPMIAH